MKTYQVQFKFNNSIALKEDDFKDIKIETNSYLANVENLKKYGIVFLYEKHELIKVTSLLKKSNKTYHFLFFGSQNISNETIKKLSPLPQINLLNWVYVNFDSTMDANKFISELKKYPKIIDYAYIREESKSPSFNRTLPTNLNFINGGYLGSMNYVSALQKYRILKESTSANFGQNILMAIVEKGAILRFPNIDDQCYYEYDIRGSSLRNSDNALTEDLNHGTNTLGIIKSANDDNGITGLAPETDIILVYENGSYEQAIFQAICHLVQNQDVTRKGLILLIELYSTNGLPLESSDSVKNLIAFADYYGITVIEPAGNGNDNGAINLNYRNPFSLNRSSNYNLGSTAVMVGATYFRNDNIGNIFGTSNYGRRIDTYAWGEQIITTAIANDNYVYGLYAETSAASAIIAGMAAAIQSVAIAKNGIALNPATLKSLLTNNPPLYFGNDIRGRFWEGADFISGGRDRNYIMPNLANIVDSIIG